MQFRRVLSQILRHILRSYLFFYSTFKSKVDLPNSSMYVWIRLEEVPYLNFLSPLVPQTLSHS